MPDTNARFWDLVDVYWPIGVGFFALVVLALLGVAWRFRARDDEDEYPGGADERLPLELGWMAIVAAVAAFLLYLTFSTMGDEKDVVANASARPGAPAGSLTIRVTAAQWNWRFDYPGGRTTSRVLVVPAGRPVHFEITSADVVHSMWILDRKIKVDAFPQRTTVANLWWPRPGSWREGGQCSQYCGLRHTTMNFAVRALPGAQFDRWLGVGA